MDPFFYFFRTTFFGTQVSDIWNLLLLWTLARLIRIWRERKEQHYVNEGNDGLTGSRFSNEEEGFMLTWNGRWIDPEEEEDEFNNELKEEEEEEEEDDDEIGIMIGRNSSGDDWQYSSSKRKKKKNGFYSLMSTGSGGSGSDSNVPKLNFLKLGKGRQATPRDSKPRSEYDAFIKQKNAQQLSSLQEIEGVAGEDDGGSGNEDAYDIALTTARTSLTQQKNQFEKKKKKKKTEMITSAVTDMDPYKFEQLWHQLPISS